MLTHAQYERLPGTAREIVDTDRTIAAVVAPKVVPFHVVQPAGALRELLRTRRVLTTRASEIWGKHRRSDGTVRA